MEVYKSVYDLMLSKAIYYGYVKQQVHDILTESHDRVDLSMLKNIPDAERYWMAERWTWETLCQYLLLDQLGEDTNIFVVADESDEFPGEKPKWKRVTHYLKHKSPATGETPKSTQVEASDSTTSPNSELENRLTARPQNLDGKTSEVKLSVPKRIVCVDTRPEVSGGKQAPKSATGLLTTSSTSSSSERESQTNDRSSPKTLKPPLGRIPSSREDFHSQSLRLLK
ncbi:uncharacterized protein EAE97_000976 [Botrytis byssoidea]|uniref:Uncharacterized protein n=1 Tax=Botrytis byssoidea TaxID=139641 RepID=A0A9P5ITI8_9HELO|nr:uncharacterized protein EAE97_000976 [Botrytis byssoidea]KAF7953577.1 hypothetical protein EAE97_000976 [Botrytis byssoidea]